jgi:hypothetical protein
MESTNRHWLAPKIAPFLGCFVSCNKKIVITNEHGEMVEIRQEKRIIRYLLQCIRKFDSQLPPFHPQLLVLTLESSTAQKYCAEKARIDT